MIILNVVVLYWIHHKNNYSPHIHHIAITDYGFLPKDLSVLQGDEIIFSNRGKLSHWPASNIHPTHTLYTEFDSLKELKTGENWSFQFNKKGDWKYHDHLYPAHGGIIRVKDNPQYVDIPIPGKQLLVKIHNIEKNVSIFFEKKIIAIFPFEKQKRLDSVDILSLGEREDDLKNMIQLFGPEEIMDDLLKDTGNGYKKDCHQTAHKIGRISFLLYESKAFEIKEFSCHSGYYHGAMEAMLEKNGVSNLPEQINSVCKRLTTQFEQFECFHGIGHGVLAFVDYDMPEAIKICKSLPTYYIQSSCLGGVMMENVLLGLGYGARSGHSTKWLSDDPHFPCNKIDPSSIVQDRCYVMQTSWMLNLFKGDFKRISEECLKAKEEYRGICFQSLGRDAASQKLRNPQKTIALCRHAPQEYYDACITGGLNVIVEFLGPKLQTEGADYCNYVPEDHRKKCFIILKEKIYEIFITQSERKKACERIDPEYNISCS